MSLSFPVPSIAIALLAVASACAQDVTSAEAPASPPATQAQDSTKATEIARDADGRPLSHEYLGKTLPAFSGALADGGNFDSAALVGEWTVIEVWGLWCHDSMNDAPFAAALSRALAQDPDVDFMSIHTPQKASRAHKAFDDYPSVAAYFDDVGYRFPTVVDSDASIRDALAIRWTPTYLLIGPDLSVQDFRTGLSDVEGEPVKDYVRDIAQIRGTFAGSDTASE